VAAEIKDIRKANNFSKLATCLNNAGLRFTSILKYEHGESGSYNVGNGPFTCFDS